MEGPDDPAERVEAIRAGIARLAPFEPECVLFLTGPGDDREAIARGHPRDRRRGPRAGRAGRARADPARVRALLVGRQLAGRGGRADRRGRRRRRPAVRHVAPLERAARARSSATATGSAASTSPTGASRPATRTTACCPATASSTSARSSTRSRWDGFYDLEIFSDAELDGSLWREDPRELAARGVRGAAEDGIDRVCIVGAGVIGSLYAGHLAPRLRGLGALPPRGARARAERARACASPAGTTSPRACGPRPTRPSCPSPSSRSWLPRRTELDAAAARLEGHWPGAAVMTVQNGLGAEDVVPGPARHLGGHVHERHAPLGHARRVHPRHRDVARPLRRHAVRAGRGDRRR